MLQVQADVERIIKERAEELGIKYEQAYEIYKSIFLFVKVTMEQGDMDNPDKCKSIYIRGLGTFAPKLSQIRKMKELRENKNKGNGSTKTSK